MRKPTLSGINTLLLIAIIVINGYVLTAPLIPAVSFWARSQNDDTQHALSRKVAKPVDTNTAQATPADNTLIIPSMLLEATVHTGPDKRSLRHGLWLRPNGSSPDKGSNTVIVGHRFTYNQPEGVLYHLNKVAIGDTIGLYWHNTLHRYQVTSIQVVSAHATEIEAPTAAPRLTIYTCTPLWLPRDRLVVIAKEIV